MGITSEIPVGESFDLAGRTVGLERETGRAVFVARTPGQPPNRIVGYTVQASPVDGPPPHGGEMHPDADELLYLISGQVRVSLELADGGREVGLSAGQAMVVPRGTWHQIHVDEPGQLLNITPGPGGQARPPNGDVIDRPGPPVVP
ncbi:MAG TPA: cupin domain-containing protein [Acidimicrobiales bacterium]|nr:cupin domain-containing protein [Acidimicrobiales bacterium]